MKNVIKVIVFFIIFVLLLIISSQIVVPKNNLSTYGVRSAKTNKIMGEKNNSLDTVFIGDSLVYTALNPMYIWENYGFTSYDLAMSAQYLYESYSILESIIESQKPKIVFLETNQFFRKYKIVNIIGAEGKKIFPIFEYHNRWKDISLKDIFSAEDYSHRDSLKGFRYMTKVNSPDNVNKNYMKKKKEPKEIPDLNYYYIEKIINKCKENNIEIILLSTPSMKNCNYSKYLAIKEISQEFEVSYLDLNLDVNLNIDWANDTVDKGDHLNFKGSKKVSEYIGNYLQNKGFVDHRNDANYKEWNEDLINYKKEVKES